MISQDLLKVKEIKEEIKETLSRAYFWPNTFEEYPSCIAKLAEQRFDYDEMTIMPSPYLSAVRIGDSISKLIANCPYAGAPETGFHLCPDISYISLPELPHLEYGDGSMGYFLNGNPHVEEISIEGMPLLEDADYLFAGDTLLCDVTIGSMPSVKYANNCFENCTSLEVIELPPMPRLSAANSMFTDCTSLISVSFQDLSNLTGLGSAHIFTRCLNLTDIAIREGSLPRVGVLDLGITACPLSEETLIHLIDKLLDASGLPVHTFIIGEDNLAKLTDEQITVATDKNWALA